MIPVVLTASGDMFVLQDMNEENTFSMFYNDNVKKYPFCQTYDCKNVFNINDFIAETFIKIINLKSLFQDGLIEPTYCMNINKYSIKNGDLPISKIVYDYFINNLKIKVDYFYDNKWNKFNIDCYNEFKELYIHLDEITVYNISYNIIESLRKN